MPEAYIWLDGEMLPAGEATINFNNASLHYGLAVFEGIRCYEGEDGPAVFRLKEHLERFLRSARVFMLDVLPYDLEDLSSAVHETIRANQLKSCYIRPVIYMDDPPTSLNLDNLHPKIGISAWEWGAYLGDEALERGSRMMISSFTRHHINVTMTKAKISGNYANSVLAKTLATRCGFDEAVMLDPQGYVAECSGENIFYVRDGVIFTPSRATVLEGVTRDSIITLAGDLGHEVIEEPVSRDQLYIADEVFVCGTAAECVPVSEIDFIKIGEGRMGPVTREIQKEFFATVRGEGERSAEWLDYVTAESRTAVLT
jgi:branched-chain amino acid aminotransferase